MAVIAIFGGTGFAGGHIAARAVANGHSVISIARNQPADAKKVPGVEYRAGSIHDPALVKSIASQADVIVVSLPARELDGEVLLDALPSLVESSIESGTRLSFVGGAGSLKVSEDGPRGHDLPEFPDEYKDEALKHSAVLDALRATDDRLDWFYVSPASEFGAWLDLPARGDYRVGGDVLLSDESGRSYISGADYASAFVDEIENPTHSRSRFSVAY